MLNREFIPIESIEKIRKLAYEEFFLFYRICKAGEMNVQKSNYGEKG